MERFLPRKSYDRRHIQKEVGSLRCVRYLTTSEQITLRYPDGIWPVFGVSGADSCGGTRWAESRSRGCEEAQSFKTRRESPPNTRLCFDRSLSRLVCKPWRSICFLCTTQQLSISTMPAADSLALRVQCPYTPQVPNMDFLGLNVYLLPLALSRTSTGHSTPVLAGMGSNRSSGNPHTLCARCQYTL